MVEVFGMVIAAALYGLVAVGVVLALVMAFMIVGGWLDDTEWWNR